MFAANQPQRDGRRAVQVEWLDGFERTALFEIAVDRFLRKSEFKDVIPYTHLVTPNGSILVGGNNVEL